MGWTVIESFVEGKIDGRLCEDIIVQTPDFGAVIDGASDATGAIFGGLTGGRFAAEAVAGAIERLDPACTSRMFADALTRSLAERLANEVGTVDGSTRWPAATVVCLSFQRNEIWRIGDSSYLSGGQLSVGKMRVAEAVCRFRAAFNSALLQSGVALDVILSDDPGRVAAGQLTNIQQHFSNTAGPWGYGCINGRPIPDEFVEVFDVDSTVDEVVVASDGYPELRSTLDETEQELRGLLDADPCGIDELWAMGKALLPGANSLDDRAYLRFRRSA